MKIKLLSKRRSLALLVCLVVALTAVYGCTLGNQSKLSTKDIVTQKKISKNRVPITVLVKYAFSINEFEKIVEEKFPNIDIIQVGNYTSGRGLVEYERRLKNDDLPDIVMTWPLNIGEEYWDERLIDMSGMSFTSSYHTSMLNKIDHHGKLYYLPGPAQVRSILYNKTLFAENNWRVPNNFEEFVALCQKIEASGIRSLQLGFANSEVLDTAFVGFSYGNNFSRPLDSHWMSNYDNGEGDFGEHFGPALDTFQYLINAGIFKKEDLNVRYQDRERMFFSRKCAMVEDSLLLAKVGAQFYNSKDEFALMPFFNPNSEYSWARLYMVCYIGANKHLLEEKNKEKYELVLQLLDYISTPEGQVALAADTGAMFSSVQNTPMPDLPVIEYILPTLNEGRYAIFPELKNAQQSLRQGLAGMLAGTVSREQLVEMVNRQNSNPSAKGSTNVIGNASESFTLIEMGSFITDAMRARAGSDFALFLDNGKDGLYNGKGVSGCIYKGPQTEDDINRILPDFKDSEAGSLQKVIMSGADLINTLEYSISIGDNLSGWFYYFSGLKLDYDPTAAPGDRIRKITDLNNNPIDKNKLYSVAIADMSVNSIYIVSMQDCGVTIKQLFINTLQTKGTIAPAKDGRFIFPAQ